MHLNVINISWECIPFDFDKIKQYVKNEDYGLYQIYGQHPAYGQNSLLYIGKANDQKFGIRLNQRWEFVESCAIPTHIRLGKIIKSKNECEELEWDINLWGKMIDIAEKMLIKSHSPAFNKQENTGLFDANLEEQFLILNWEDRGSLLPEISTLRYSFKYWNYEEPLKEK